MNRRISGFTLIEVVISLAILAIAFFGLISVITYTTRMNMSTKERMLAMRAAEKKIEQMLGCGSFDNIYLTFRTQAEGLGWEVVDGLEPVVPAPVAPPTDAGVGYLYPTIGVRPVLFVRFPLNDAGTGFDESQFANVNYKGSGKFADNYSLINAALPPSDANKSYADLDLNGNNTTTNIATDRNVQISACKILPVNIEVYWRGIVGPSRGSSGNNYLVYRYTFLRKP